LRKAKTKKITPRNRTILRPDPFHGPVAILTSTRAYDMLNRLTNVSNNAAGSLSSSYGYNAANQRTNQLREDGAYWVYQYDSLGQVTNGNKYFSDGTLAPGGQFNYQFDTIGNRTQTMTGGDTNGANLRAANYAANDLNELTNRDVPGFIEVQGSANSNATVTVNGTAAYRHLDYYRAELGVNNAAAPVYQAVTNQGALSPDAATLTANALVAATSETFIYDADGNLLSDGKWNYTWDGENRLTALESLGTVPSQARSRLEFAYDGGGRRIFKRVKVWDAGSGAYQVADEQRYWYDGWNLIGRTSRAAQEVQVYAWGLDLSGSLQGAGGVGGLLWLNDSSATNAQTSTSFYAFDGNGNVLGLVASADGTFAAQYEYAPFGEVVRSTGPLARSNPFRFSTKYQDDESDLLYYGYRYYNASTGNWPNRDPIAEHGGVNLFSCARNNTVNKFDLLGLDGDGFPATPTGTADDIYRQKPDVIYTAGPDVTEYVKNVLDEVQKAWDDPKNKDKHCLACQNLRSFASLGSWDITPLRDLGQTGRPIAGGKAGTGDWARTVQFRYNNGPAKVYWGGAVNYALWGKANALCHKEFPNGMLMLNPGAAADYRFDLDSALGMVDLRKNTPRLLGGFGGDQDADADAFTKYGYDNSSPESVALPTGYVGLTPDGKFNEYHEADPNNVVPYKGVGWSPHWEGLASSVNGSGGSQ